VSFYIQYMQHTEFDVKMYHDVAVETDSTTL